MTALGDLLAKNELRFASGAPESLKRSSQWWLALFGRFTFTGDLIDYITSPKTTDALLLHDKALKEAGFSTMKAIVEKYVAEYPNRVNERISPEGLMKDVRYTSRDICALAKNQNENLGMYMGKLSNGTTIAILKATINGDQYRDKRYPDAWLDDSHTRMKYCLQTERNTTDFEFQKKENKAIFDGLTYNLPVPIYLFVNLPGEKDYAFCGVYQANALSTDRKSFTLVHQDRIMDENNFHEYFQYMWQYRRADFKTIADRTKLLREVPLPSGRLEAREREKMAPEGNPDYLELQERLKILGDFGEEKALQFERNRVAKFAPELVDRIQKVSLDKEGYDIDSFRKEGRNISKVKIEVKTTTNTTGLNPFFMSGNEYGVMDRSHDDYWLYRIFNVHSTNVSLFRITEKIREKINFIPDSYRCEFRTSR